MNLDNTLGDEGQPDEALAAYLQAAALGPDHPDIVNNLLNDWLDATEHVEKKQFIEQVQDTVAWVGSDLPWFSKEEALVAHKQRDELLESLSGWATHGFHGSKLHSGALSPGCSICGNGNWGCNFINGLCTRNCFFCPQDRSMKMERESYTDDMKLRNPTDHITFVKIFGIQGVGFSGGEPLLVLDKLLSHITALRQEFGKALYLWVYTNGDRVNRTVLMELQRAGLDEIRFDLGARKYDLAPVVLSKEYIPTVSVETPAIPEDFGILKDLLGQMEAIGVDFLNLHQLFATSYNYPEMRQRNYHLLRRPLELPVFESELCALKLLAFAREQGIRLPINYCCHVFKQRFQGRGRRIRQAKLVLNGFEELTTSGFVRSFRVADSPAKVELMIRRMEKSNHPASKWQCNETMREVAIHSDLLGFVDWSSADVTITYFLLQVGFKNPDHGFIENNLGYNKTAIYQESGWSEIAIQTWRKLYVEKATATDAFRFYFKNVPMQDGTATAECQKQAAELKKLATWEEIESGLSQVY